MRDVIRLAIVRHNAPSLIPYFARVRYSPEILDNFAVKKIFEIFQSSAAAFVIFVKRNLSGLSVLRGHCPLVRFLKPTLADEFQPVGRNAL